MQYWADLYLVHGFSCGDNIAPNVKCQQVLVLYMWLIIAVACLLPVADSTLMMLMYRDESTDVERIEVEEEKQLTLDEWKAMQERDRARSTFNIRKPGEGCQTRPEWKKMHVLKKKVEDEKEDDDDEYYEEVIRVAVYLCRIIRKSQWDNGLTVLCISD